MGILEKAFKANPSGGFILVAGLFADNLDYPVGGYAAVAATVPW